MNTVPEPTFSDADTYSERGGNVRNFLKVDLFFCKT